jgi:hypothetical protein
MKKHYILLLALITSLVSFGQERMLNGGFESWDDPTTPTSYSKAENTEQESTEVHSGTYAAKHTGGTRDIAQTVPVNGGTTYTISMWYKVDANFGDGTDARIWSNWKAGSTNLSDDAADLKGPNNAYLDNNSNVWTQYSVTLTAPATADALYFEVRTYGSAVVYYDDFSVFEEAVANPSLGIGSPSSGDFVEGPDVNVEVSVQNFIVDNGIGDGHISYSVDGGQAIMKYDTTPINLTGLTNGEHTIEIELVDNSNASLSPAITASVTFTTFETQSLPYTETFNYTAGEALGDQDAWTNYFSGDDVIVQGGSLTYANLSGSGNSITFAGNGTDPVVDYTPTSSGKIYASFMLKITALDASAVNGYFAVLRTSDGDYASRLWISPTGESTYRIGISNGGSLEQINAPSTDYSIGDTIFVVFNYDIDNDTVNAWINNGSTSEPTPEITEASGSTENTFSQLLIRQDSTTETPDLVLDELRIGTSWSDVVPAALSVDSTSLSSFSMYPNPTKSDFVNIASSGTGTIEAQVFDILGKRVINAVVNNNRLNVSSLNTGVYVVKLTQDNNTSTKKLIIQ